MTTRSQILDFYTQPDVMTALTGHGVQPERLPDDIAALARIVQSVLLHEHIAPAYGQTLAPQRRLQSHIRPVSQMLDALAQADAPPLAARAPEQRLVGVCRHFTLLMVAMLRAKGIPARARCGFGAYFQPGKYLDHWVCEYWNEARQKWILVDAQIDDVQRALFKIDFDTLDVARDQFLVAGDAWALCRAGTADAGQFGILDMHGLWFIASNIARDAAALNNMAMLPWDVWGNMAKGDELLVGERLAYFDRLAAKTRAPDDNFAHLRALYRDDERLRVPPVVFNAVLNRPDAL